MVRVGTALSCLLVGALLGSTGVGSAATSGTTVSATVPSATSLDLTGCPSEAAGVTSFGSVTPGASSTTSSDCTVGFGSSNDTARLRILQADATGSAMNRVTWSAAPSGVATDVRRVEMATALVGYAVTNGRVLKTSDGGATWSVLDIAGDGDPTYWGVAAVDASTVWVSGASGHLWRSNDGGTSWTRFASGVTTNTLDNVAVRGSDIYAAGDLGTVLHSRDAGSTWSVVDGGMGDGNTVAIVGDGVVLTAGTGQVVRRTTDGGATWSTVHAPGRILESLSRAPDGSVWVAGASGHVARSLDLGATWTTVGFATSSHLEGIHAFDRRHAVGVARTPTGAWSTSDGGGTWTALTTGATGDAYDVGGVSADRLVTVGAAGELRRLAQDEPIAQYGSGVADWDQGTNMFAACLRAIGAGTSTDGTTWSRDTSGTVGDCQAVDTDPWNPIGTTASSVALAAAGTTNASASLRFGLRTAANQRAGRYLAPLRLEVVAPS